MLYKGSCLRKTRADFLKFCSTIYYNDRIQHSENKTAVEIVTAIRQRTFGGIFYAEPFSKLSF